MNVEEMVARIRELSVVGSTALLPVTSGGEYLQTVEIKDGKLVLIFTNPYNPDRYLPDVSVDFDEPDYKGIDF